MHRKCACHVLRMRLPTRACSKPEAWGPFPPFGKVFEIASNFHPERSVCHFSDGKIVFSAWLEPFLSWHVKRGWKQPPFFRRHQLLVQKRRNSGVRFCVRLNCLSCRFARYPNCDRMPFTRPQAPVSLLGIDQDLDLSIFGLTGTHPCAQLFLSLCTLSPMQGLPAATTVSHLQGHRPLSLCLESTVI